MSFNERFAKEEKKTFTPPEGVQSAARKALKWIEEGHAGSGFTGVGRGRAHQLANGEAVSLSTIKRMHSFFSRHRVDKQGKDWNKPSPGKVAWYAWGGDAGASWAKSIAEKHDGKKKEAGIAEHLQFLPEIAKGVGHVIQNTFMEPENAVKSVGHFVNELATGQGATPTPKDNYYGTSPFHLTKTEEGAPGAAYLINKGMDAVKGLMPKGRNSSTFSYNSKNAGFQDEKNKFTYYEKPEAFSTYSGPSLNQCGRCGIDINRGSKLFTNRNFGRICPDCRDVLTAKPEEE